MTINEDSLLRRGIHSELFLLAYSNPDSGYRIAQLHQDTKEKPDTSKTSLALKKLRKAEYLIFKDNKFYPNIEKLAKELLEYLYSKDIELNKAESKIIANLLGQNSFFVAMFPDIQYRLLTQAPRSHHIDALQVIANNIGMMATFALIPKKKNHSIITAETARKPISKISDELDGDILNVNEKMSTKLRGSKSVRKKKMESVNDFGIFMKSFILGTIIISKASQATLEKLEELWEQHDGFQAGLLTSEKFRNISSDSI